MTRKERVQEAVNHQETDAVPWNVELTGAESVKVCEHLGIEQGEYFDFAGNHIEKIGYNIGGKEIGAGFWQDEFGVVWDRTGLDKDIGVVREPLLNEPILTGFELPGPPVDEVRRITEKVLGNGSPARDAFRRDTFKLGKIGMTYFERAWSLRGMENLMMDMALNPAFAEELFAGILDYNMEIIAAAAEYDIDGFYFADDYGQQTGMLMSPDMWRRFIKPGLGKMFERVKSRSKVVCLHCCGNITEILGDLIDIGLDVYQTVQPEVYDLAKLKKDFGRNLTFWGAISTQKTLPFVTPAELKRTVRETIEIMAQDGGYICSATHRVPPDVPVENVLALLEVLKSQ